MRQVRVLILIHSIKTQHISKISFALNSMKQMTMGLNFFGLQALVEHMEDNFEFKATLFTDWVISYLPME